MQLCKQSMLALLSPVVPQKSSFLAICQTLHVLLPVLRNNVQAVRLTDLHVKLILFHRCKTELFWFNEKCSVCSDQPRFRLDEHQGVPYRPSSVLRISARVLSAWGSSRTQTPWQPEGCAAPQTLSLSGNLVCTQQVTVMQRRCTSLNHVHCFTISVCGQLCDSLSS